VDAAVLASVAKRKRSTARKVAAAPIPDDTSSKP
jgi:hypothetical protein